MAAQLAAMSGVPFLLQDAQTGVNNVVGNVLAIPPSFRNHNFIIRGNGVITGGSVQLEHSNDPNYTGTWDPLTPAPIEVPANSLKTIQITALLNFVRARIVMVISGGTVSVEYEGAKSY